MLAAGVQEGVTESTVIGPFYVLDSPQREWGESVMLREGDDRALVIHGHVRGPDGSFLLKTIRPTSYPIPTDGTVGELLRATNRHPFHPAHVHAIVSAPGYRKLTTHLFDAEDTWLDSDVVFAVKSSLIRQFECNESADAAARWQVSAPFWELHNDFVLSRNG